MTLWTSAKYNYPKINGRLLKFTSCFKEQNVIRLLW